MAEIRKIFQADGKFWMELKPHELEDATDVRWFDLPSGPVPTAEVHLVRKE